MGKRKRYSLAIFFIMVFLTGCGLKGEENAVKETAQESSTQNPAQSSAGEGAESDSGEEGGGAVSHSRETGGRAEYFGKPAGLHNEGG